MVQKQYQIRPTRVGKFKVVISKPIGVGGDLCIIKQIYSFKTKDDAQKYIDDKEKD